jgi:hypothetical protein
LARTDALGIPVASYHPFRFLEGILSDSRVLYWGRNIAIQLFFRAYVAWLRPFIVRWGEFITGLLIVSIVMRGLPVEDLQKPLFLVPIDILHIGLLLLSEGAILVNSCLRGIFRGRVEEFISRGGRRHRGVSSFSLSILSFIVL